MLSIVCFLAILAQISASVVYMHPVNPALHPPDMYPIQREVRNDKVRDLPQSGIVYLKKIKPISDEFLLRKAAAAARDEQTFINKVEPEALRELPGTSTELKELHNTSMLKQESQENIDYSVYDERDEAEDITSTASTTTTSTPTTKKTKISSNDDLSNETLEHLDNLLAELTAESNPKVSKALLEENPEDLKALGSYEKPSRQQYQPKLITLAGSARVHSGSFSRSLSKQIHSGSAKLVKLQNSNKNTHGLRAIPRQADNADFDPWERMGQRFV
ncbi:unnamed protein product [Auanema sp. JU1783]|nr:unnamed protein product [Auanema sp. JU1783]